jgi:inner membrane protein
VTVAADAAQGSYHLRRGLVSVAPAIAQAASCPAPVPDWGYPRGDPLRQP